MNKYEPKPGSRTITNTNDVRILGVALESMEAQDGDIDPVYVLTKAKRKRHILHRFFEWDDTVAAHEHRLLQASKLINSVQVVIEREDQEPVQTQAFVRIASADGYRSIGRVLSDAEAHAELVEQCRAALTSVKDRYQELKEFAAIWSAIGKHSVRRKAA